MNRSTVSLSLLAATMLSAGFTTSARANVNFDADLNPDSNQLNSDNQLDVGNIDTAAPKKVTRSRNLAARAIEINGISYARIAYDDQNAGGTTLVDVAVSGIVRGKKVKISGISALGVTMADDGHTQHAGKLSNPRRNRILANNAKAGRDPQSHVPGAHRLVADRRTTRQVNNN